MMFHKSWPARASLWVSVLTIAWIGQPASGRTQLAKDQKAALTVVVSDKATEPVRKTASNLADYLQRISGATFEVKTGDGKEGIVVGIAADFLSLELHGEFDSTTPAGREQYLLRSHAAGVYVIGATERAVEHGAWDLLYRLGHRHFFPGQAWEIVPHQSDLAIDVNTNEIPDYLTRSIWYGFGTWKENGQAMRDWQSRNRAVPVFRLNTGHAYGAIIRAYKAEFDAHPEYLCQVDGKRTSKLCAGQQEVRDLVVRYALEYFAKNPDADSVSIDPSDGGGWGTECPCVAIGSPSDRALTFANDIGNALEEKLPGKYVAMYAYNEHSPPPTLAAHPRVIITVATSFIHGGYSVEQLLAGWRQQGVKQFGIREYYSVNTWDRDLPGRARGGNLGYLTQTIPHFHQLGARFMTAEAGENWGPNGLGYYLATRIMWDIDEAQRIDELKADFLGKAFGPATKPMETFYELLDGANQTLVSDDMVGRMYRAIDEANTLAAGDPAIQARLDDLTLYTRYVELYRAYSNAGGKSRQAAFETLIRYAYRIRRTTMVHGYALYRDLDDRDKSVSIPAEAEWNVPDDKNPWKASEPFSRSELDSFVSTGIASYELVNFKAVAFGDDLVPAAPLKLADTTQGKPGWTGRGERVYYTWIDKAPAEIRLKITGGMIAHYRNRGDVKIQLVPKAEVEGRAVAEAAVPPDGQAHDVTLSTSHAGLHRIELSDGHDMTRIEWDSPQTMTFETSVNFDPHHNGRQTFVFYVPRGTTTLGGFFTGSAGALHDGQDRKAHDFTASGFFEVPVPRGQDGKLWSVRSANGQVKLMTVPPYVSHGAASLLLPREVVEADAR